MRHHDQVRFRGKTYPVLDTIRVHGKPYCVIEDLGHGGRKRYCVFHQNSLWTLHVFPYSRATFQHLRVVRSVSESNYIVPTIIETQRRDEELLALTKWIDGPDLATYLNTAGHGKHRGLSSYMAFTLYRKFVHGLCHFHGRKHCVHGDLKPENLIVANDLKQLVMIDFGSAWYEPQARQRTTGDGRTIGYAAPELKTETVLADARADQFSINVVLYEMLTGELPYDNVGGKAGWPEFRDDFSSKFVPPSRKRQQADDLPNWIWDRIDNVVERGLQLDPNDRYPTGQAWRADLDAIQSELHRDSRLGPINRLATAGVHWLLKRFR